MFAVALVIFADSSNDCYDDCCYCYYNVHDLGRHHAHHGILGHDLFHDNVDRYSTQWLQRFLYLIVSLLCVTIAHLFPLDDLMHHMKYYRKMRIFGTPAIGE